MENSSGKNRLGVPDFLKGLAVLFMVQVHITELFATQEIYNSIYGKISLFLGGPPAAPVFMVVMGYFMGATKKNTSQIVLRGVKLFAGGILLNIGLNAHLIIRNLTGEGAADVNLFRFIFGVDILLLAGLSFLFYAVIRKLFSDNYYLYFAAALIITSVSGFAGSKVSAEYTAVNFIIALFYGNFNWNYFPFIPWAAYPLLGIGTYHLMRDEKFRTILSFRNLNIIAGVSALVVIFTFKYGLNISAALNTYYHHNLLYSGWVVLFLIAFVRLASLAESFTSQTSITRYIKWAGKNVTAFYVVQWFIIGNLGTAILRSQTNPWLFVWFGVVLLTVSLFVVLFEEIKNAGGFKIYPDKVLRFFKE